MADNLKVLIFDFDGVILKSADIKTEAFRELFRVYPEKLEEIIDYHQRNGGISRYVKFRHIYEEFLNKRFMPDDKEELGRKFSEIVLKKVLACPFNPGVEEFLNDYKDKLCLYVASGTPSDELDHIMDKRNLGRYFKAVYGSPAGKSAIIKDIIRQEEVRSSEVLFIGDAVSDYTAAKEAGVPFLGFVEKNEDNPFISGDVSAESIEVIGDFVQLRTFF